MNFTCRFCLVVVCSFLVSNASAWADGEPQGLILRKGLARFRASLDEVKRVVETEVKARKPKPVLILKNTPEPPEPDEKFTCEREETPGVIHCRLACCVNLGENDTLRFATLYFHKGRFYAYEVPFATSHFAPLLATAQKRLGKPTTEEVETEVNPNPLSCKYTACSYVVRTKRWEMETTRVVIADRGGAGAVGLGSVTVVYLPVAKEIAAERQEPETKAALPF